MTIREIYIVLRNVFLGGNLASMRMLARPKDIVIYATESLFLRGCMYPSGGLPQRQVWEVLGSTAVTDINICHDAATEWFRTVASFQADLLALCMLCKLTSPKVIFEIGTLHGSGTLHLAANSTAAQVYSLDLPSINKPTLSTTAVDRMHIQEHAGTSRMFFENRSESDRIHLLYGDSAKFDFSPFTDRVDFFFIDGAHSYEYVRNDTEKALSCVRKGGVIAWHDYGRFGFNGVTRSLNEFARSGRELYRVPGGSLAFMIA